METQIGGVLFESLSLNMICENLHWPGTMMPSDTSKIHFIIKGTNQGISINLNWFGLGYNNIYCIRLSWHHVTLVKFIELFMHHKIFFHIISRTYTLTHSIAKIISTYKEVDKFNFIHCQKIKSLDNNLMFCFLPVCRFSCLNLL